MLRFDKATIVASNQGCKLLFAGRSSGTTETGKTPKRSAMAAGISGSGVSVMHVNEWPDGRVIL